MEEKWLFLRTGGEIEKIVNEKPTLEEMQEFVGGYIEYTGAEKKSNFFVNSVSSMKKANGDLMRMKVIKQDVIDIIVNQEGLIDGLDFNYIATAAKYNLSYLDLSRRNIQPLVGNVIIHYEHTGEALEDDREYSLMEATTMLTGVKQDDTPMYGTYGSE
jgi:hypothetical protein